MITAELVIKELEMLTYKEVLSIKDEKTACSCVSALFNCLYLNFKTRLMYIPSSSKEDIEDIEKERENIYADYINNLSYQDLAVKYHRSVQNIYAITKAMRKQHVRKHQSDLFPLEPEETKKPITLLVIEEYLPNELTHCGLTDEESKSIANKISEHLLATFPGVSITISNAMKRNRAEQNQTSLF